ncbi:MAG: arabinose-5-phosphate isomerase [Halieaceae bacterium]|jgi:arabinose-5-phosphate isomerase
MTPPSFLESARRTIAMESEAICALGARIDNHFSEACQILLACKGRVVVTGIGKSGHIATKIASTLASTGTPAMFVHPGEASHGDMGMITPIDTVIALSNSGQANEILTLLPLLKRMGIPLISLTGNADSELARAADVNLDTGVDIEACPLDLAPTSSTTVSLVMGDAIAIALLEARGFTADDFAFSHPGGVLGRRLLLKVEDVMHTGEDMPKVGPDTLLADTLLEVNSKGKGMTTIVDHSGVLLGVFTDGDLRRAVEQQIDLRHTPVREIMSINSKTITRGMLAGEALRIMDDNRISVLVVVDNAGHPEGVIDLKDLLKAGVA